MTEDRKGYVRTTVTLVVLSEGSIPDEIEVSTILRECEEGDYVLSGVDSVEEHLTGPEMADALYDAGSEPGFFMLTDEGEPESDS